MSAATSTMGGRGVGGDCGADKINQKSVRDVLQELARQTRLQIAKGDKVVIRGLGTVGLALLTRRVFCSA